METLIQINNEKRKLLNEKNKRIYEEMLLYIRLSYDKSEEETEEILMELLDHLLVLQKEDREAEELFGDDPKGYADEIIGELPIMVSKKRLSMFGMGVSYFLATAIFFQGFLSTILFYIFGQLEISQTYSVGTVLVNAIFSLSIAALMLFGIIRYLRWSCFKQVAKVYEFFITGILFGVVPVGMFMVLFYVMPSFGATITFDAYWLMPIGVLFFFIGQWFRKKV